MVLIWSFGFGFNVQAYEKRLWYPSFIWDGWTFVDADQVCHDSGVIIKFMRGIEIWESKKLETWAGPDETYHRFPVFNQGSP